MTTLTALAFAEGVTVDPESADVVRVRNRFHDLEIPVASAPGLRFALERLGAGAVGEGELAATAGPDAPLFFLHLERLVGFALVAWTVVHEGVALATLAPLGPSFSRPAAELDDDLPYRLSRFAYLRAGGAPALRVESPLAGGAVTVGDPRVAALLFDLTRPASARSLGDRVPGLGLDGVRAFLALLLEASLIEPPADTPAAEPAPLGQWEFHDLLFHERSRGSRHAGGIGATYRFAGRIPPLPAIKPPAGGEEVALRCSDLDVLRQRDPPLVEAMERRRSIRAAGRSALAVDDLAELLFRCARSRRVDAGSPCETGDRPYPGAGALYELEIYPAVHACAGLARGLYHYDPARHRLERTPAAPALVEALLDGSVTPGEELPGVLLVISARFQRMSWKYESIAYSLILKDVGVLMQTIYLAATAMDLAACAVGFGDPQLFCRATGLDRLVEASVGEIAISGRPA